jgi:hypothetical protein
MLFSEAEHDGMDDITAYWTDRNDYQLARLVLRMRTKRGTWIYVDDGVWHWRK